MPVLLPSLGFPPGLLGDNSCRVKIIAEGENWIALDKPAGIGVRAHPWDKKTPDLDYAVNRQIQRGVKEFKQLEAKKLGSVYYLDPTISGVALFAKDEEGIRFWRNRFGSGQLNLKFLIITRATAGCDKPIVCEKPIIADDKHGCMHISPRRGKKTKTEFQWISTVSGWSLWEAQTCLLRPHQIRIHAAAAGIPIAGDPLYAEKARENSSAVGKHSADSSKERIEFKTLPIHLASIQASGIDLRAVNPPQFRKFL